MILDTNALSAIADGNEAAMELVGRAATIAIPVIVLAEYRVGIAQSRHHAKYETWLREWISAVQVLDVEDETAKFYAALALQLKRHGTPIPTNDLWIAALCAQHALPLLSRDRHFDVVAGLNRIAW
ncbi:MAG TPA: type II toxin-antitoxin system VapC family toxin [Candidatus Acidoferrales bacterium]|nr:type II toxin-antitoxin system VapC family toxin [Candidatus Acidoferrales bacterium]